MTQQPQVWHYGLVAQWWAEFNTTGPEIAYFQKCIERYGQPALDVACGTGRLLLPYLRAGLDVDGCDISSDMLTLCQEKAAGEGLTPQLYPQAMHELDLPRTYKTIFACGSFGLGGERQHDKDALHRLYRHLEPGGVFIFDNHLAYKNAKAWQYWVAEKRPQIPKAWPASGERRRVCGGTEMRMRLVDIDPLEQLTTLQIRIEAWREGKLVAEEENILKERLYFRNELLLMLEQTGFGDVTVYGDYTETEATAEHGILVFIARKA